MNILLIQGHPDNSTPHFLDALADAFAAGATEAGHTLRRIGVAPFEDASWFDQGPTTIYSLAT